MHANKIARLAALLLLIGMDLAAAMRVCPAKQRWDADADICVPCPDEPVDKTDVLAVIHYNENCRKYPVCCSSTANDYTSTPTAPSQPVTVSVEANLEQIVRGNGSSNINVSNINGSNIHGSNINGSNINGSNINGSRGFEDKSDSKNSSITALPQIDVIVASVTPVAAVVVVAIIVILLVIFRKKLKKCGPVSSDAEKGANEDGSSSQAGVNSAAGEVDNEAEPYSTLSNSSDEGDSADTDVNSRMLTVTSQPVRGSSRETYYQTRRGQAGLQ